VFDLDEVERFTNRGLGSVPASPFNAFGHATGLATPDEKFVSINNDTIYSIANIDVSGGPVRFDVPATHGRYYVMQLIDAWTNNFAYVGHRATGTDAASFLLVAPGWQGEALPGATVIRFPAAVATILGRWAVDGEADVAAVRQLQDRLHLTHTGTGDGLPAADHAVPEDLRFFEKLRVFIRYSIGDRTPGLRFGADGALTITMQHEEPNEPERRANWLPTPSAAFRPLLRMYEPHEAVFNGGYELPAITAVR